MKKHVLVRGVALCVLAAVASIAGVTGSRSHARTASAVRPLVTGAINVKGLAFPPDTAYCQANLGISCYSPIQLAKAYGLDTLRTQGIDGRGKTIAIVDAFGSPTIANDLAVFDAQYGLPNPNLSVIQPVGAVPPFDPTNGDMVSWATETTLDVEWAHAFAPGAKILLVETPVAETEGVQGFPEIVAAENYVVDNHLADVISQSFGATEQTFPNAQSILDLRSAFVNAQRHHVTVLASAGDTGATNYMLDGTDLYPNAVNAWPSSDPLVTSIGGTQLHLDANGSRLSPDVVWNDGFGATGGGVSSVFSRPSYQGRVNRVTGKMRGTPDISLSAAVDGAAIIYYSFQPGRVGWHLVGGTSESSPEFSGVVAMADQVAGQDLGLINPALYRLGYDPGSGIVDVTTGNNSFAGVTGYSAGTGYDLASGLGTLDASKFVPALAAAAADDDQGGNSQ